jgi:hypothetical protein
VTVGKPAAVDPAWLVLLRTGTLNLGSGMPARRRSQATVEIVWHRSTSRAKVGASAAASTPAGGRPQAPNLRTTTFTHCWRRVP